MRNKLFSHIERLPSSWFMKNQTGDIIQRCTSDVETVKMFLSEQLTSIISPVLLIVMSLFFMFSISTPLALIALCSIPVIVAYSAVFHGKIGKGFLILLGVGPDDTEKECRYLAEKALGLRIFTDENDKMNLGLDAVGGEVLVVSQFTLYGNCRKGRRPSFTDAANPELGERLYEQFLADCASLGYPPQHGRFGADMKVESVNDGPVTLILDTGQLMDTPRRK